MTTAQNRILAFWIITTCYLLAVFIPDIGTVISVAGATVNPFIGFLFPIIFYLKIAHHDFKGHSESEVGENILSQRRLQRMFAVGTSLLISVISVVGFV